MISRGKPDPTATSHDFHMKSPTIEAASSQRKAGANTSDPEQDLMFQLVEHRTRRAVKCKCE
jgi:hypothetical protein